MEQKQRREVGRNSYIGRVSIETVKERKTKPNEIHYVHAWVSWHDDPLVQEDLRAIDPTFYHLEPNRCWRLTSSQYQQWREAQKLSEAPVTPPWRMLEPDEQRHTVIQLAAATQAGVTEMQTAVNETLQAKLAEFLINLVP